MRETKPLFFFTATASPNMAVVRPVVKRLNEVNYTALKERL